MMLPKLAAVLAVLAVARAQNETGATAAPTAAPTECPDSDFYDSPDTKRPDGCACLRVGGNVDEADCDSGCCIEESGSNSNSVSTGKCQADSECTKALVLGLIIGLICCCCCCGGIAVLVYVMMLSGKQQPQPQQYFSEMDDQPTTTSNPAYDAGQAAAPPAYVATPVAAAPAYVAQPNVAVVAPGGGLGNCHTCQVKRTDPNEAFCASCGTFF